MEFVGEVGVLGGKVGGIVVGGELVEEGGVGEENGLYVKKIMGVVVEGLEGNGVWGLVEGVGVGGEREVGG